MWTQFEKSKETMLLFSGWKRLNLVLLSGYRQKERRRLIRTYHNNISVTIITALRGPSCLSVCLISRKWDSPVVFVNIISRQYQWLLNNWAVIKGINLSPSKEHSTVINISIHSSIRTIRILLSSNGKSAIADID